MYNSPRDNNTANGADSVLMLMMGLLIAMVGVFWLNNRDMLRQKEIQIQEQQAKIQQLEIQNQAFEDGVIKGQIGK
jgi:uncharacterized protein HemX